MNDFMRIGGDDNIKNLWGAKPTSAKSDPLLEALLEIKPDMTEEDYLNRIDNLVEREFDDTAKKEKIKQLKLIISRNYYNEKTRRSKLILAQKRLENWCAKEANKLSYPNTPPNELDNILKTIDFEEIKWIFANLDQCYKELLDIRNEAEKKQTASNPIDVFFGKGKSAEEIIKDKISGKSLEVKPAFTTKLKEMTDMVKESISKYTYRFSIYNSALLKLDSYIADA